MKKILWVEGIFGTLTPGTDIGLENAISEIAGSDFDVVIFAFMHCMPTDKYCKGWHLVWDSGDAPFSALVTA